jgi:hypothetical protein
MPMRGEQREELPTAAKSQLLGAVVAASAVIVNVADACPAGMVTVAGVP